MEWHRGEFVTTCDLGRANFTVIAEFLERSYWARSISFALVRKSVEHSLNFILLKGDTQIGSARVVSDLATSGYLGDVFVLPEHRGLGLGQWLIDCVMSHPDVQGLRRRILAIRDAHELYEVDPNVYGTSQGATSKEP